MNWNWKWRLLVSVVFGASVMFVVATLTPKRYRSEATIAVVAAQVPVQFVPSTIATSMTDRLPSITQRILSRAKLESMIDEQNLYRAERKSGLMEDIVAKMKTDIEVKLGSKDRPGGAGDSFTVAYVSTSPQAALKVTERLAAYFKDENLLDREATAEHISQFLEAQALEARTRLEERMAREYAGKPGRPDATAAQSRVELELLTIDKEVLIAQYRSILAKQQEARMDANLEAQEIGQQFKVIDPPRTPEKPISPDRVGMTVGGALIGLAVGIVWTVAAAVRRWAA